MIKVVKTEKFEEMSRAVKANKGFCPCRIERSPDTKCMCKEFRDQVRFGRLGKCYCGMYEVVEVTEENSEVEIAEKSTQEKIKDITSALCELLQYKNKNYGDSALNGVKIFSKVNPGSSICIRLDDKLARIANADQLRTNDVCDVLGYLVLLVIEMKVSVEDIKNLMD